MTLNKWETFKLDEVYEIRSGLSKKRDQFGFGYSFLTFKEVFNNYFLPNELTELVNSTEQEREKASIMRGDVFLTRTSETQDELGMSSVALKDYPNATFNGFTKRLRPKGNVELLPEYAGYYFRSPKFRNEVTSLATLTTRASLNNSMLSSLTIDIPPLQQQKEIANILSSLDDKIEINNAIIANLEEQAQAIFKSWFIDFEPFQSGEFTETELGVVPEGWEIKKLSELFEIKYGKNLPTKKLKDAGYPVFGGNGQIGFYHEYLYEEPKLLISCRGAASGKVVVSLPYSFITNNSLIMDELNHSYFNYYKYLFNNIEFENYATGSAQPQITITNIKDINIYVTTDYIVSKFNKIIDPIYRMQLNLQKENKKLEEARDILLPKLMSGEIQVGETVEVK